MYGLSKLRHRQTPLHNKQSTPRRAYISASGMSRMDMASIGVNDRYISCNKILANFNLKIKLLTLLICN